VIRKLHRKTITLKRDLGLFEATVAGVGIIVGAGIYVLIGAASGHAGNGVWISFLIAAFVAFLTGLSYAELSSIYDDSSGEYSYIEHTFGKRFAFVIGYLVMFAAIVASAAVALGFSGYFTTLFGRGNPIIIALSAILFFTLLNLKGIKQSMRLNSIFTVFSIIGLLFIVFLAIPNLGSIDYFKIKSLEGVFKASSLIFFAYLGFDSVVQLSEETKNPKKNIPLALLLALGISTIIYIAVSFASISTLSWESLSVSSSPLSDVAEVLVGNKAAIFLGIIALMSTSNTIIIELVAVSRLIYGMSQKYSKIRFLSKINKYTQTPHYAIFLTASLISLFVLLGDIETVAEITNFTVYIIFASINLALIKSRYIKHAKELFHEPLNIKKFPVLGLLGFFATIFMLFNLEFRVLLYGSLITGLGFLLYQILKN